MLTVVFRAPQRGVIKMKDVIIFMAQAFVGLPARVFGYRTELRIRRPSRTGAGRMAVIKLS